MKLLPLSQGKLAIIDEADFEKVGHFKWSALKQRSGNFYAVRHVGRGPNRTLVLLHGEILGIKGIDHKNGNGLDCRRTNLRPATMLQNNRGFKRKAVGCSSRFRGVHWCNRERKWLAGIKTSGKQIYVGRFVNEVAAARAYDEKAKELGFFQEALNFPI